MNGAVERAVRSWEGQFRTVRDHVEGEIGAIDERQIDAKHPLWQWCAWWASSILNRYVVRPNGRTTYELITGHQTKMLVVGFGQHVLWRLPRKRSGAGKLDVEWYDGIFLGLAGTSSEAYIGTANGVEKANDFRLVADSPYSVDDLVNFKSSVREYVEGSPDDDAIAFPRTDPAGAFVPEPTAARRMRLNPDDFKQHGYTKDCPGCVSLRDGTMVRARRNHTEACRSRMEEIIGGDRVRRAGARRERELDEWIQQEDSRVGAPAETPAGDPLPPTTGTTRSRATSDVVENVPTPADEPPARRQPRGVDERQGTATRRPAEAEADPRSRKAARTQVEDFGPLPKRHRGAPPRGTSQADYTAWMRPNRGPMSYGPDTPPPDGGDADGDGSTHEDLRILSPIIRGVDIMELYSPPKSQKCVASIGLSLERVST